MKKVEQKNLPPKIPRPPQQSNNQGQGQGQGNLNYKLPPRPGTKQSASGAASGLRVNQSYDYNRDSRQKSVERQGTEREKSKQNLQKAGERLVSSR